jgi:hypothetical protein
LGLSYQVAIKIAERLRIPVEQPLYNVFSFEVILKGLTAGRERKIFTEADAAGSFMQLAMEQDPKATEQSIAKRIGHFWHTTPEKMLSLFEVFKRQPTEVRLSKMQAVVKTFVQTSNDLTRDELQSLPARYPHVKHILAIAPQQLVLSIRSWAPPGANSQVGDLRPKELDPAFPASSIPRLSPRLMTISG